MNGACGSNRAELLPNEQCPWWQHMLIPPARYHMLHMSNEMLSPLLQSVDLLLCQRSRRRWQTWEQEDSTRPTWRGT